jgi:hypothetical protein
MQKAVRTRVVLMPVVRVKRCAFICKQAIERAVFSVHLLFREGLVPLSLFDYIHQLPLLHTVRQLIGHDVFNEFGSRQRVTLILRGSSNTNQHECDCERA